jgi:class 3 adenylate cyclase
VTVGTTRRTAPRAPIGSHEEKLGGSFTNSGHRPSTEARARRSRTVPRHWSKLVPRPAAAFLRFRHGRGAARKRSRNVAALFLDIEGCTRLCEELEPEEMNAVIEGYFSAYLDVVREAGGEVTEILGDGLLALFEATAVRDAARAALRAAVEIATRTQQLNGQAGRGHDAITVNIGFNAGCALVGLTRLRGRLGERWVYAATGPVTNVAARLSALARGGQVLTTRATADLFGASSAWRSWGPRRLKNVTGPVEVVEVVSRGRRTRSRGRTSRGGAPHG